MELLDILKLCIDVAIVICLIKIINILKEK